ncbi:hypothetical protein QBC47DRAFT_414777 [Echria macrotheca]|uniref:Uncharacterized protein n=1 Tax=Echria macrotheca TaxID=438768 RepID=A0AAJ0BBT0_9PEZI|nr:hypothetical protein QBC47DRAFT_414777 [Echria macrotheca]
MHLSTLIGAVTLAAAGVQGACDYYQNDRCIKPKISFSAEVPFSPLFRSSPTFVYAVDELDRSDLDAVKRKNNLAIPSSYNGPVLKAAWWLQYDNSTVNKDRSQQRRYYAFALETGKAVGTGNTCDGLLGPTCARNLKSTIAAATLDASPYTDGGLGTAISSLYYQPPPNLSCPADIFGTRNTPPNLDVPLLLNSKKTSPAR